MRYFPLFIVLHLWFLSSVGASETITSFISNLENEIARGEVDDAISLVDNLDVASLAKLESKRDSPKFLAIAQFNLEFPGLSRGNQFRVQESGSHVTVPGVGKEYPNGGPKWEKAAFSFAFRFNLHLRHQMAVAGRVVTHYSLEDCRDLLHIEKARWEALSLESRLRVQLLVENYADAEKRLSQQTKVPGNTKE